MCWKWHQMSALAERSGGGEVKPSQLRAVMKTDSRTLTQGTRGKPQLLEPPGADPHAGWCGRGERETAPPIPIAVVPQLNRAAAFLRMRVRATGVSRAYCETPTTIDSNPQAARATTGARDNNGCELRSTGPWRNRTQTVQREESCHKGRSQRFHAQIVEELVPVVNHMWDSGCGGESAHSLVDPASGSKSR